MGNLLQCLSFDLSCEYFETLEESSAFKLERIVSRGQSTPKGQWLNQNRAEWVCLIGGAAGLLFEGEAIVRVLRPGDYLLIPPNVLHRVEWTQEGVETIWLALHYSAD